MATLAQVIAVRSGIKQGALRTLTDLYNHLKPDQLSGLSRTYAARDDAGEQLPSEQKQVQTTVQQQLEHLRQVLERYWDLVATVDYGNTQAAADVLIEGRVLLPSVPITALLFYEKQLGDMKTALGSLPVLDPGERWDFDGAVNCYRSDVLRTTRTKKTLRNHVKAEATDKHPAQVEIYTEDETIGYWSRTLFSGAVPERTRSQMVDRVTALVEAMKMARERANVLEVPDQHLAHSVLDYVLQPL